MCYMGWVVCYFEDLLLSDVNINDTLRLHTIIIIIAENSHQHTFKHIKLMNVCLWICR